MASCGAFPPFSDKGAAFVHDPKSAKVQEVKGSIKMLFSKPDKTLLVSRIFQAAVAGNTLNTKKKPTFKALDCTAQIQKGGTDEERAKLESLTNRVLTVRGSLRIRRRRVLLLPVSARREAQSVPVGALETRAQQSIFINAPPCVSGRLDG